ncbi:MAG: enoyl-CoA hydratase/isomerase family protein [Betaproteobacteria bacterium]|jgi:enoyl-CoA hydratase|nr:enoyl-CoA hydratase-related protein [Rubrivivax sp.]
MTDAIRVSREGPVVRVTLDRPDKHNCVSTAMWRQLGTLFEGFDADESLRCIVLAGAGGKAFSVGADIAEFPQVRSNAAQAREYGKLTHGAMEAMARCRHPLIAAVQGMCVGGGLELASICDMRYCTESSRFGIPVKRLGLVVAYAELLPLARLVGPANAKEILLEGTLFGSARAREMGLVNRVLPDAGFEEAIAAIAASIAQGAPLVARWHKQFVNRLADPAPLTAAELDRSYHCFDTEDFQIGTEAFRAKTQPMFKGR